jgi:DNA-binding MarR family transcriptional regulator
MADNSAVSTREVDAVLAACRGLVAISVRSLASVEGVVDATQLRALVVVASRGSVSLGELAAGAGLTLSTASRLCDRLVAGGLMHRQDDPANRRQLVLTLTQDGKRVVKQVTDSRRRAIEPLLRALPEGRRRVLADALEELMEAGGEPSERDLWAVGWTT